MDRAVLGVQNVVATMAIENMHLEKHFINELLKIARGERSSEEVRREVLKKYAR